MSETLPPAIFLMGPTASGKTGLAVQLVRRFPLEIISVDSALVYRGMDIGSAKPDADTLRAAPHRLIDIRDPAETYSAADFRNDALREMQNIAARGRVPLLVGGTLLYFRALQHGLSALPAADAGVRSRLQAELLAHGLAAQYARLQRVDPETAARLHPTDPQRIQRALEVYEISGMPMSEWLRRGSGTPLPYRLLKLALIPEDRAALHQRIETRLDAMLAAGFADEVSRLMERPDLTSGVPAMRAVGYRQLWAGLAAGEAMPAIRDRMLAATRQYARRQLTWLRSETDTECFPVEDEDAPFRVIGRVDEWLAGERTVVQSAPQSGAGD